jgi:hypothetical protein
MPVPAIGLTALAAIIDRLGRLACPCPVDIPDEWG